MASGKEQVQLADSNNITIMENTSHIPSLLHTPAEDQPFNCSSMDRKLAGSNNIDLPENDTHIPNSTSTPAEDQPFNSSSMDRKLAGSSNIDLPENDLRIPNSMFTSAKGQPSKSSLLDRKPFECGLCSVTFDVNVELVTHVENHSLTKPFKCGFCKVSYDTNTVLIAHVKTHAWFWIFSKQPNSEQLNSESEVCDSALRVKEESSHCSDLDDPASDDVSAFDIDPTRETEGVSEENKAGVTQGTNLLKNCPSKGFPCEKAKAEDNQTVVTLTVSSSGLKNVHRKRGNFKKKFHSEKELSTERTDLNVKKLDQRELGNEDDNEDKPFQCNVCGATFRLYRYMKDHQKRAKSCRSKGPSWTRVWFSIPDGDNQTNPDPSEVFESSLGHEKKGEVKTHVSESGVLMAVPDTDSPETESLKEEFIDDIPEETEFSPNKTNQKDISKARTTSSNVDKPFPCNVCGASFRLARYLKDHQARTCLIKEKSLECPDCGKILKSSLTLKIHRKYVHSNQKDIGTTSSNVDKPFPCNVCGTSFRLPRYLKDHQARTCLIKEKNLECPDCGKILKSSLTLKNHRKYVHSSDKPFSCSECSSRFKGQSSLRAHIAFVHNGYRPFHCTYCSAGFHLKSGLSAHVRRKHTKECPYKCVHCTAVFSQQELLYAHVDENHDGQRADPEQKPVDTGPYVCAVCGKVLATRRKLLQHTRDHTRKRTRKPTNGKKPFVCETCGLSFARLCNLRDHRSSRHLNNRPFQCDVCQKTFNSYPGLWVHKKRHLGDKKFPCGQCEKKFLTSGALHRHMLTHTDLRPYACSVCGKTYRTSESLKYHFKHSHEPGVHQ